MHSTIPYIIAEIGCNHNGDLDLAKRMIDAAAGCGCQAVKLQLFRGKQLATRRYLEDLNAGTVRLENVEKWESRELGLKDIFEQVEQFTIGYDEHVQLFRHAARRGIGYASTAIDRDGVDFLVQEKVDFVKLSSMDANHADLIEYVLSKNVPLVLSLGMASLGEIEDVVRLIPPTARERVSLLHCVSLYPPRDELVNLNFMKTLKKVFGLNTGYSDHTLGYSIALAAVAAGATIVEKHFTLDKNMPGWDHRVSADPEEMKIIVQESRRIVLAMGDRYRVLSAEELEKRDKFRRSWVSTRRLERGTVITEDMLTLKRPGTGIAPSEKKYVLGRTVRRTIDADTTLAWENLV